MTSETSFAENVIKAFKSIIREIEKGSSEHDVRYRFVKYFVEEVLGYEPKYIKWEKKRADLTIIDENDFAVIKIETKRPTESIDKAQHEEQAFKYEEETTRFIGLTNFLQFKLWEVKKTGSELRLNLDFSKILEQKKPIENLSSEEKSQILFLNNLTKETLFDTSKYEKFDKTYARIDITKDAGFRKLLDRLNFIATNLLLGYTLRAFGEYNEGYNKYQAELIKAENESKNNKGNHELKHSIAKYRQKLEEKYQKYKTFSGYELWKDYSGKSEADDDEVKEIFCKETIYVLLNKLLFIRICEDKKFLKQNISNGGIEQLRNFLKGTVDKDEINKEVLEFAYKGAKNLYSHFYEIGILDWFRTGDGDLNELLNRVLWILNQFDFTHVDRDILGNLYEKYLPSVERKKLGEFYTPTEVIDYILTSVGYTYSYDIETKDLLDPACGSGGFLVRASRRLISRYLMKFRKTDKKELRDPKNWKENVNRLSPDEAKIILEAIQEHIYGLDINPFACHIAEMNILFQIIDLYQKVREKHPDYKLKRFKIYRTDSLEKPTQKQIIDYTHKAFLEEQDEIDSVKEKKFDFVVGNPPYVRQEEIDKHYKSKLLKTEYAPVFDGRADLYIYFIYRGLQWLKSSGRLSYITSNKFINSNYGTGLREFLSQNCSINTLIDFGDLKVFKDAHNYTCIFTLSKVKEKDHIINIAIGKPYITELDNPLVYIYKHFLKSVYEDDSIMIFGIEQNILNSKKWSLSPSHHLKLRGKIDSAGRELCYYCDSMIGMRTGVNEIFVVDSKTLQKYRIEKTVCKKCVSGKDIRSYRLIFRDKFVLYPDTTRIDQFPNLKQYLSEYKQQLSNRAQFKQRKDMQWYEIEQPVSKQVFESEKILTPAMSDISNFTYDNEKYYCLNSCCIILVKNEFKKTLSYYYLLGILNSKTLEFFIKQTSPFFRGRWYSYEKRYLDVLPIKLPETAEEKKIAEQIIKKVDEILELHKSRIVDIDAVLEGEETEKLYNLPKVTFSINENAKFEKIKSDDGKIFINSQDFIEIKDKKIRDFVEVYFNSNSEKLAKAKDVKNMLLNISIPKSDEILKEIIKKSGADQSQIKEKIKKLENEINELVYHLYDITKEERKIIEDKLDQ